MKPLVVKIFCVGNHNLVVSTVALTIYNAIFNGSENEFYKQILFDTVHNKNIYKYTYNSFSQLFAHNKRITTLGGLVVYKVLKLY